MFTDNKRLIGRNPIWDMIQKNVSSYEPYSSASYFNGFLTNDNKNHIRKLVENKKNRELSFKLNRYLSNQYLTNKQALNRFSGMVYYDFLNVEQWEYVLPLIDVFDFNDDYYPLRNKLTNLLTELYSSTPNFGIARNKLMDEFHGFGYLSRCAFDSYVTFTKKQVDEHLESVRQLQSEEFMDVLTAMHDEINTFLKKWPEGFETIYYDSKKYCDMLLSTKRK